MTFSAASFAECRNASAPAVSSSGRGQVPLIGEVSTSRPRRRRNSSGLRLATAPSAASTYAPNAGGSAAAASANSPAVLPATAALEPGAHVDLVDLARPDQFDGPLDRPQVLGQRRPANAPTCHDGVASGPASSSASSSCRACSKASRSALHSASKLQDPAPS